MNYAITENPYEEGVTIATRGVMTDAKIAKLNNDTKRPALVANWEQGKPVIKSNQGSIEISKVVERDYDSLLDKIGIGAISYQKTVNSTGAKKLRVNKIVVSKTGTIYDAVKKEVIEEAQKQDLVNQINALSEPTREIKREDVHGRHEHTGEIPVNDIKEAVHTEMPQNVPTISRMERNAMEHENVVKQEEIKQEPKAGDIDLYNNLLHSGKEDDVSRQLQGAREELSIEKEESKKLAEQYSRAVRELEELKLDIENKRKIKAQQERRELSETLNNLETLKKENLERTSDLSSIQSEIAKLRAERQEMESNFYDNSRSFGRRAA